MPIIYARRTQWSVGHGGFHSGFLGSKSAATDPFVWIYDCGSASSGKALTREFKEFSRQHSALSKEENIHLLFLSHFHEDHVGGLGRIKRSPFTVKQIYAPLVSPLERLQVLATSSWDDPDPFFLELLADPLAALSDVAENVTFIEPSDEVPREMEPAEGELEREDELPDLTEDDGEFIAHPSHSRGQARTSASEALTRVDLNGEPVWVFEPYVLKSLESGRDAFRDELKNSLGLTAGQLTDKLSASSGIMSLIDTSKKRNLIRAAHHAALKSSGNVADLNLTSLCLYAGPISPTKTVWKSRWPVKEDYDGDWTPRLEAGIWRNAPGWLHTGDASLKDIDRVRELLRNYNARWSSVGTFLLPHHGSDESFHAAILGATPAASAFIAAAQPGFRQRQGWFHPGRKTTSAVQAAGRYSVTVSESIESRFTDTVSLKIKRRKARAR